MASALKVLLLLPVLAHCQIDISVQSYDSLEDALVTFSGESIDLVSDQERNTFQITDWQLTRALERQEGERPDGVHVRDPTPWSLYSRYGWSPVQRKLRPIRARIVQLESTPVIVTTKFFDNRNFSGISTFRGSISLQKQNTFTSTWSQTNELSVAQEINYSFNIGLAKAEGTTRLSFATTWGEESSKSESTTLGSETGIELELEGGQAAVAELSARRGALLLEVEYEAALSGQMAANYAYPHEGHYFWAHDVNAVLRGAGLRASRRSTQTVRVGFYCDDTVEYKDYKTGERLPFAKK